MTEMRKLKLSIFAICICILYSSDAYSFVSNEIVANITAHNEEANKVKQLAEKAQALVQQVKKLKEMGYGTVGSLGTTLKSTAKNFKSIDSQVVSDLKKQQESAEKVSFTPLLPEEKTEATEASVNQQRVGEGKLYYIGDGLCAVEKCFDEEHCVQTEPDVCADGSYSDPQNPNNTYTCKDGKCTSSEANDTGTVGDESAK